MGGYLMDVFIEKYRVLALQKMVLAYVVVNIELGYLSHTLAFDSVGEAEKFLTTGLGKYTSAHFFFQDVRLPNSKIRRST